MVDKRKQNSVEKPDSELTKLAKQCMQDSEAWFGDTHVKHSIPHYTLAMAGEVGEFANIVKKVERGSLQIGQATVRYQLAMELTDVFVYVLQLSALLGIDLEETYKIVRANNVKRFTAERENRQRQSNGK